MSWEIAKEIIKKWELNAEEQEKLAKDEEVFRMRSVQFKSKYHVVKQPGGHTNGSCLIASALNCLNTADEKAKFLGGINPKANFHKAVVYKTFQNFFLEELKAGRITNPLAQYTSEGMVIWLEHLKSIGIIKSYLWKSAKRFDRGVSALFGFNGDETGKTFIMFGYRGKSSSNVKDEDYRRLCQTKNAETLAKAWDVDVKEKTKSQQAVRKKTRAKAGVENSYRTKKQSHADIQGRKLVNAQERIMRKWQAERKHLDRLSNQLPPLDGYRSTDMGTIHRAAEIRTLMDYDTNTQYFNLKDWMEGTKRDEKSFWLEHKYNIAAITCENLEKLGVDMKRRDSTTKGLYNEATGKKLVNIGSSSSKETSLTGLKRSREQMESEYRDGEMFENDEEKRAVLKRKEISVTASGKSTNVVTRHAVSLRVTEHGDIVVLDPASTTAKVVSRRDVVTSSREFARLMADFWAVYEFKVEFV